MNQPHPSIKKFRARVRLGPAAQWLDVEAPDAMTAAKLAAWEGGATEGLLTAGKVPVEVTEEGTVNVRRFEVTFQVSYSAVEVPK